MSDPQIADLRRWHANGGTDYQERADHYGISVTYVKQLLDGTRRPVTAGETILADTEPDKRLDQMIAYYRTAIATAAREYFQGLDLSPLHTGVVGLMSPIYKMTPDQIEDALYPVLNGLSIEVTVGEDNAAD